MKHQIETIHDFLKIPTDQRHMAICEFCDWMHDQIMLAGESRVCASVMAHQVFEYDDGESE